MRLWPAMKGSPLDSKEKEEKSEFVTPLAMATFLPTFFSVLFSFTSIECLGKKVKPDLLRLTSAFHLVHCKLAGKEEGNTNEGEN